MYVTLSEGGEGDGGAVTPIWDGRQVKDICSLPAFLKPRLWRQNKVF